MTYLCLFMEVRLFYIARYFYICFIMIMILRLVYKVNFLLILIYYFFYITNLEDFEPNLLLSCGYFYSHSYFYFRFYLCLYLSAYHQYSALEYHSFHY